MRSVSQNDDVWPGKDRGEVMAGKKAGISVGETEHEPTILSTVFPKAKHEGPVIQWCYEDCQGQGPSGSVVSLVLLASVDVLLPQ